MLHATFCNLCYSTAILNLITYELNFHFTVRLRMHITHSLSIEICLSVCPSNACIVTKRNNLYCHNFYTL